MNPLRFLFLLVLALSWISLCHAKEYEFPRDGFAISVPEGWIEIPKDKLDQKLAEVNSAAGGTYQLHGDHAFQRDPQAEWMSYPYVVVKVVKTGKMSESQFTNMDKLATEGAALAEERYGKLVDTMEFGKSYYDFSNHVLWGKMSFEPPIKTGLGPICAIGAMYLTEQGDVEVFGYCRKAELELCEKALEGILQSVKIAPKNQYVPEREQRK